MQLNSKSLIYGFAVVAVIVLIFGALQFGNSGNGSSAVESISAQQVQTDSAPAADNNGKTELQFSGKVLAGTKSKLYDFKQADYEKALQTDKTVFLYFHANWCSTCKYEQPFMHGAFNELSTNDVIGFRVNYKDSETDSDEEALARELGIPYQSTKVIIKDGIVIKKSLEIWSKNRYLSELGKSAV